MSIITLATIKGSDEPAHKHSTASIIADRRHVIETLTKRQAKTHDCSPNRALRMRIQRTTKRKTIRFLLSCVGSFIAALHILAILYGYIRLGTESNLARMRTISITKTRIFKYTENFTTKK